jgi:hypothetical protein
MHAFTSPFHQRRGAGFLGFGLGLIQRIAQALKGVFPAWPTVW